MNIKQPRNFWEIAFAPNRDFIIVFLLMLLTTTLVGNFFYTLLTDGQSLTGEEIVVTSVVIVVMLLFAGFIWHQRQARYFPFQVNEQDKLQRSQAVIAIPSNPGAIGKLVRYHAGILQHIWLVGDTSVDENVKTCRKNHKDDGIKFHRVKVGGDGNPTTTFDAYKKALQEAIDMGIPKSQIIVDITGGTKPMSIHAFLMGIEHDLHISYVQSDYDQIVGSDEIKRANERFEVVQFDVSKVLSTSLYNPKKEDEP